MRFLNLAFYLFTRLEDPFETRRVLRETCLGKPFRGTLLLSHEGINGMLSGDETALRELQARFEAMPPFKGMTYKESWSTHVAFPRMLVKVKKEIIPLGMPEADPNRRSGPRLKPRELARWLEEQRDFVLLDTRNDYEVDYGTFKNAVRLPIKNFRDFPSELKRLPDAFKNKPVVMFCTGGIRCEKASLVALDQGFPEVYQLDGGILNYFEQCGGAHFEGECFVFDRRIAVNARLEEAIPPSPSNEAG